MLKEKYSLSWHDYSEHLKSMMKEFMMNENFSDVTLVTDDKIHINANINILSTCSPVFRNILKKEKNYNQILYLRGILFSEMESIMQFIYLGEATFFEERMDEFISVAKSLEIKELCNTETKINDTLPDEKSPSNKLTSTETFEDQTVQTGHTAKQGIQDEEINVANVNRKFECDQCHKIYSGPGALYNHQQSVHQGVKYACEKCDVQYTCKSSLITHIQMKHEGVSVMYPCGKCDHQFTEKSNLNRHIQSKHEAVKYACTQCDYQASQQGTLTEHIKSRHEGVTYACDQCHYQAMRKSHLTAHIKHKHEGVKYSCDQCDYQFKYQHSLKKHSQLLHKGSS